MRILPLYILVFLVFACEWPFDTDETDPGALFELTVEHSITRLVDSSGVQLTWSEIIIENFSQKKKRSGRGYEFKQCAIIKS